MRSTKALTMNPNDHGNDVQEESKSNLKLSGQTQSEKPPPTTPDKPAVKQPRRLRLNYPRYQQTRPNGKFREHKALTHFQRSVLLTELRVSSYQRPSIKRTEQIAEFLGLKKAKVLKWFWDRENERLKSA